MLNEIDLSGRGFRTFQSPFSTPTDVDVARGSSQRRFFRLGLTLASSSSNELSAKLRFTKEH